MLNSTQKDRDGFQVYKRLLRAASVYWPMFVIGIAGTMLGSGVDAGLAWFIKPIINKGFISRDQAFIAILPVAIISIFLVRGVLTFLSGYFITKVGRTVVMDFRRQVFTHLMRLPASFFDGETTGQLLSTIIYNVEQLAEATTNALLTLVREGFLLIGLLIVMFSISWRLSLLFIIAAPLIAFVARATTRRMRMLSMNVQEAVGTMSHVAEEGIEGYRVIRSFSGEQYEQEKFDKATALNRFCEMKVVVTNNLGTTGVQLSAAIPIAITLYLAASPWLHISAGSFAAIIAAMLSLLRPMRRLTRVNSQIQKGIAGAESVFAILDQTPEIDNGMKSIQRLKGHLEFKDLAFTYPSTQKQVLHDISFTVEPGQTVALVGKSGSGKSTLVGLLQRFYELSAGKILLDDCDSRDYKLSDLRNQFAFVSQHVVLFNDTIAHNIAYGRFADTDEKAIVQAAKAAHAMEFIEALPNGIHSLVGENGVLLSGGQRQRIAIARALLKDAPILILDEATSALDTESERHIQAALEDLMRNRTTLVIAHRLSTIENADKIIVLHEGRIVEQGKHAELLRLNGYYARLHAMQFQVESTALATNEYE